MSIKYYFVNFSWQVNINYYIMIYFIMKELRHY